MNYRILTISRSIVDGLSSIVFPRVCICCGLETTEQEKQICSFCKQERFEAANPDFRTSGSKVILPNSVVIQHALWDFDKGGLLQNLMHYLKYERLTGIGVELGRTLADSMASHPAIRMKLENSDRKLLVPVPLHYLKFRRRGFNQAYYIAKGIREKLGIPICELKSVVRKKNTRSQTGFSIEKRISNVAGAFRVRLPDAFTGRTLVLVDDVFTTGSTTFELARQLKEAGCGDIIIATVAQA